MKTTEEIHELIQAEANILVILEHMNNKIAELEERLDVAESTARRANNYIDCAANGIVPD